MSARNCKLAPLIQAKYRVVFKTNTNLVVDEIERTIICVHICRCSSAIFIKQNLIHPLAV